MPIQIIKGDATEPVGDAKKLIIHICNNLGRWGAGFVLGLNKKWKEPMAEYMNLKAFTLGTVQYIQVTKDTTVVNMIAQRGINSKFEPFKRRVDYDVLRSCLVQIREKYPSSEYTIHAPRIGCGLAGGSWDIVEKIINEELANFNVFIYDL